MNHSKGTIDYLLRALKEKVKSEGLSYPELAQRLGVSTPTVKRWMSARTPMTLLQLTQIANIADIDFWDLFESARPRSDSVFTFTLPQEEFFAAHPHYYAFFEEHFRKKKSLEQIQKEHKISPRSVKKYLQKSFELGLINQNAKGEWTTSARGTLIWDDHGPMGKLFSARQVTTLAQRASKEKLKEGHLWLNGWKLTDEGLTELKAEMEVLREKVRQRSQRDTLLSPTRVKNFTFVGIVDHWEDEILRKVIEI